MEDDLFLIALLQSCCFFWCLLFTLFDGGI